MKKLKIRKFFAAFTAAVLLTAAATAAPAEAASVPETTPERVGELQVNDGFVTMQTDHAAQQAQPGKGLRTGSTLPAKFDLRNDSGSARVTTVKAQGKDGTCWAFGTVASAESNLLTTLREQGIRFATPAAAGAAVNLSERQLVWFAFNGTNRQETSQYAGNDTFSAADPFTTGGSRFISVPTLARWYGSADEKDLPYLMDAKGNVQSVGNNALQTISRAHLENAVYLPEPVQSGVIDTAALTAIKQAVKTDGAVSVGYHSPTSTAENKAYYNASTAAYFCPRDLQSNHEVSIVGWDDNYARTNFNASNRPAKNGAWIVKNSWGTGTSNRNGTDGYFYLSYYDQSFVEPTSFEMESIRYSSSNTAHTYDEIYQYDGVGMGAGWYSMKQPTSFANVFTARSNSTLEAVSAYAIAAGSTVTVDVYKNPSAGNPTSGEHVASLTRNFTNAGYYTIALGSQSFSLKKGETFAVVESSSFQRSGSTRYAMLYETGKSLGNMSVQVVCGAGQSYMSASGGDWVDLAEKSGFNNDGSKVGNAVIKAFASDNPQAEQSSTALETAGAAKNLAVGSTYVFHISSTSVPVFTSSSDAAAKVRMVSRNAQTGDTEVEVYGHGHAGESADISMTTDGETKLLCTVTLFNPPFSSDTTVNFIKRVGDTYCFRIIPDDSSKVPSYTSGNGKILATGYSGSKRLSNGSVAYYYQFTCKSAGEAGIYITIDGVPYRVFYCTVQA